MPDLLSGPQSLNADLNKVKGGAAMDTKEGRISPEYDELALPMSDDELISLKKKWLDAWISYESKYKKRREGNQKAWLGKNYTDTEQEIKDKPMEDNEIFEAVETFLPVATKANPEPVVTSDNTPDGVSISDKTAKMLSYLADRNSLKLQLKQAARHWVLFYLGAIKVGYDKRENEIISHAKRPQQLILDPNSTIQNGEYDGEYIGEYRHDKASTLIERFPKKKDYIISLCDGKLGTILQYIEWWTDDYVFWSLKDEILAKSKNPHWNYETQQEQTDEFGATEQAIVPGKNHFSVPKKPYCFLSVFNLGTSPLDETSLVEQVLTTQERISKRYRQIDKNADNMNGGLVLSGRAFTKEQAANAADALRRGAAILVPNGEVGTAYKRDSGLPLPRDVYQDLIDSRNRLKQVFGISGLTVGGVQQDRTVRGKMITRQQDTDRIGGGFAEYLEQTTDRVFNWYVQLMYVYYDEPHVASIIGNERAVEYVQLSNADFDRKLTVTVREGSLIPKDSMSKRAEAIELWGAGAMDPISLFTALEFPNPREQAKTLYMWQSNPASLFPDLQAAQPPPQQAPTQTAPPQITAPPDASALPPLNLTPT